MSTESGQRAEARRRGHRRGSALVVALWVTALLSLFVATLSFDAQVEARITSYYRKRTKAEFLARSGVEVANLLMIRSAELKGKKDEESDFKDLWWFDYAKMMAEGLPVRGMEHELGEGKIVLDVVPEPARRNVNALREPDWERLLEVSGVPQDMWPALIDAFFDWTDRDNERRRNGAETDDYYGTLDPPRRAKNGPLDTVEELLLVKGFSKAILSGGALAPGREGETPVEVTGIEDMLTYYGDGRVNVNAASLKVLTTLPDVDDLLAAKIVEEREGYVDESGQRKRTAFENVNDLFARVHGLNPALRNVVTTDSQIYRVTAAGVVGGVRRQIRCVVASAGKARPMVLQWREEDSAAPSSSGGTDAESAFPPGGTPDAGSGVAKE